MPVLAERKAIITFQEEKPTSTQDFELCHALAQLAPELRAIFMLKEESGLSYQEIAQTLNIPEGTVGSRLNRARRALRKLLTSW
ncbi:RNA polymerase sigma factor [Novipirellula artificiosorum]|uniref:ECF RNA polymerase sigma factor SigE n=1 Tax=Novipirellula artificiosorum TaxID=2528016 RepID=A0A5C6E119_9BACT|nr:sigma-70 family RNA polymerase sigma factor [Novipirellula artificiosorum]TWU42572.1 ECF RNA polymerase sigma factor SigE [Novipirellula artificiosorum]